MEGDTRSRTKPLHCARNVLISSYFNIALIKKLTKIYVGITAHLPKKVRDEIRE